MWGFDRFAVKVGDELFSRVCGNMFMIQLKMYKPDMKKIAPEQFQEEMGVYSSRPDVFTKHLTVEEYAKADGDYHFVVAKDGFYVCGSDGVLTLVDNAFIGRKNRERRQRCQS